MIKRFISNSVLLLGIAGTVLSLPGCSYTRIESMQHRNFREAHSLEKEYPEKTFSKAQQFLHTVDWIDPVGANNLDNFNAFEANQTDHVTANAISASLSIPKSPWLALNNFLVSQSGRDIPLERNNILILMKPIQSDKNTPKEKLNAEVLKAVDLMTQRGVDLVLNAYKKAGTPVTIIAHDENERTGYLSWYNPTMYIPDGLEYCPTGIKASNELTDQELEYCATIISNRGYVSFVDSGKKAAPFTPEGSFAYKLIILPDGFPVESLSSDKGNAYVFMPSFIYRKSDILSNASKNMIFKLVKEGRISLNPLIKNIHTNQYHYFNPELTKYQGNELKRLDTEALSKQ